jgi:arylsulfatase
MKQSAWQARNETLPTTYLTALLIEDILLERQLHGEAVRSIVLPEQIELSDYIAASPPRSTPHVFFIMLEAVPWNHFPFTGYPRSGITPNLSALAEDSLIFPRSYATANHSSYAQPSIHSAQYPLRSTSLNQYEHVDYPKLMLFDILPAAGYQTAFISAQNEDWLGMKRFIFANTELEYFLHSKDELGEGIDIECKIDDSLVLTRALEFLDRRTPEQPVFLYMNFQRTHFPYDIPDDAPRPYQPCSTDDFKFTFYSYDRDHVQTVINKFDNALHYVDQQVGGLIDYLKQNGLYEESLIIVSADHGQAFYEHGYPTHSTTLYDSQMRVCTLIKQPGQRTSAVRSDPISLIDINPTILEVLGMENHPNFQGQPILKQPREGPIYLVSHGVVKAMGIVDFPWKYFKSETRPPRMVHLGSDPMESMDRSADHPEILQQLKEKMESFRQQQLYYYQELSPEERGRFYPPRL